MAVTLSNLHVLLMDRLGDRAYAATGTPSKIPSLAIATRAINDAIRQLLADAHSAGYEPLTDQATIDVGYDNATQVVTINGSPTGGTFRIYLANAYYTAVYNVTTTALRDALRLIDPFTTNGISVSGTAGASYTITWADSDDRQNIPAMTVSGTLLTGGTSPTISVVTTATGSLEREHNLQYWLRTIGGVPNLAGNLKIAYIGSDGDVPIYLAKSFEEANNMKLGGQRALIATRGDVRAMYKRGPFIGFVDTPTAGLSLRATYRPDMTALSATTDTLDDIGLEYLNDYADLVALTAATQVNSDVTSAQITTTEAMRQRRKIQYDSYVWGLRPVSMPRHRSRWDYQTE